jgi:hypothetical protein
MPAEFPGVLDPSQVSMEFYLQVMVTVAILDRRSKLRKSPQLRLHVRGLEL